VGWEFYFVILCSSRYLKKFRKSKNCQFQVSENFQNQRTFGSRYFKNFKQKWGFRKEPAKT